MRRKIPDEVILDALLTRATIRGAAEQVGCSERTISGRMREDGFKGLYAAAKDDAVKQAAGRLAVCMTSAVAVLAHIMIDDDATDSARIQAAQSILKYGLQYQECTDIIERIEALEQEAEQERKAGGK